jgi:hypothetical protein
MYITQSCKIFEEWRETEPLDPDPLDILRYITLRPRHLQVSGILNLEKH